MLAFVASEVDLGAVTLERNARAEVSFKFRVFDCDDIVAQNFWGFRVVFVFWE